MSELERYKELHKKGQFKEAIKGYQELLKTDKNNEDLHFSLAHALAKEHQLEDALQHVNSALGMAPHAERYLQFKGQLLLGLNQLELAVKAFQASIKENPNLFYSYLALGDIYTIWQQPEKAEKQFQLALKVYENALPAIIKMARLDLMMGYYEKAFDRLQEAELQYPNDLELKLQLGIVKLETHEDALAELYFRQILKQQPSHLIAQAYLSLSLAASDQQQAAQIVTQLTQQQTKIPEVMVAMGMLYHHTNRHRQALTFLEPVARSGIAMPSWIMAYAKSLAMAGELDAAIKCLKSQLQIGDNPQVLLLLGQLYQSNKDYEKAIQTYTKIKSDWSHYDQACIKLAEVFYQKQAYEDSLQEAENLIKKDPNHPSALKLAVHNMSQLNRFEQAVALIEGIDKDKHSKQFTRQMGFLSGLLHDALGHYDVAWGLFQQLKYAEKTPLETLTAEQEKQIAAWPKEEATSDIVFLFSDAATGHHDFVEWLLKNNHSVLLDRFSSEPRSDVFDIVRSFDELSGFDETQVHLLRKKYLTRVRTMVKSGSDKIIDCLPFSMAHAAIAKKVFPGVPVIVLTRNFADFRLHNHVFGTDQVHFSQFTSVLNQVIAMGLNLTVVDIDEWKKNEATIMDKLRELLGDDIKPYQHITRSPLEQLILPYMHWKNYKELMN